MLKNKTAKLISISLAALTITGCSLFGNAKIAPYSFNSVKIEFAQSGNIQGTTTLYIKGDKSLRETHAIKKIPVQEDVQQQQIDNLYLDLGEKIYQIDLTSKNGQAIKNPLYNDLKNLSPDKRIDFLKRTTLGLKTQTEATPTPKEQRQIAGQQCDLYEIQGVTEVCIWQGLTIYEKTSVPAIGIDSTTEATKIEINPDIPDDKFVIPEGVTIKES